MPVLEVLRINGYFNLPLSSHDGLDVPALRELDAGGTGIKEIEALQAISHRERVLLRSTDRRWRS